jgi:hypothetical protein
MHESQQKAEHVLNAAAVRIPRGLDGCEIVWIVIISLAYKQNSRALPSESPIASRELDDRLSQ